MNHETKCILNTTIGISDKIIQDTDVKVSKRNNCLQLSNRSKMKEVLC